jgi:hypothetical protein
LRGAAINALNQDFDNRDCRWIMTGGAPRDPGIQPYAQSRFWSNYVNRMLFPQLLSSDEMKTFYMMDHQTFYGLVQQYAVPFLQTGGPQGGTMKPQRMTADSLLVCLPQAPAQPH